MTSAPPEPPPPEPPPPERAPTLEAEGARIAVDDAVVIPSLTRATRGDRVLLTGDVTALLAAMTWASLDPERSAETSDLGRSRVVGGALRLLGRDVARGDHFAAMGAAALDPLLPLATTAIEYVAWGARLGGAAPRLARSLAASALAKVNLANKEKQTIGTMALPERRALVLAQAIVLDPAVLVAEAPLAGLEGIAAERVAQALHHATEGRAAVVSVARLDPATHEGAMAREATDLWILAGGELVFAGSPEEVLSAAKLYAVTVIGNAQAMAAELAARGIEVFGGGTRCAVALTESQTTGDILAAAAAARAPIVELAPLFG